MTGQELYDKMPLEIQRAFRRNFGSDDLGVYFLDWLTTEVDIGNILANSGFVWCLTNEGSDFWVSVSNQNFGRAFKIVPESELKELNDKWEAEHRISYVAAPPEQISEIEKLKTGLRKIRDTIDELLKI